ncbi:hypothetical protein BDA99DRAFT_562945 [Phascolomyces articulosus]|uniref:Uncharacterized protein n=1 Tax=Phascolomyces articulosus TaxID=60185 RepID=A0AAD5JT25_9FUNG|nr:hypothetical protein BDA99DRAFT_562945 [Phascolomyces articulosus]
MVATKYLLIIAIVLCIFTIMAESYPELEKRGKKKKHSKKRPGKKRPGKHSGGKSHKNNNKNNKNDDDKDSSLAGMLVADVSNAVNHVTGGFFKGFATFFHPVTEGGKYGACHGIVESDKSRIVALSTDLYGDTSKNSRWCGRKVFIQTEDGKKTTAKITDACPTYSLDLTPAVYDRIAKKETGIVPIKWCACGTEGCNDDECT